MTDEFSGSARAFHYTDGSKPVVLHVLHSWGGGIDFFAKDLQAGDRLRRHFFLKSHSRDNLAPFGKELSLYEGLDQEPLATWYLSSPVMDTQLHSDEVARILDSIIEKWAIGAVIVSSLIGHSLDVLRTGLPTALAVHDVYPFWPLLHDANTDDHSIEHLRQSLIESQTMNVFAPHDAEYWVAIRDELISLILQNQIACISPSAFAKQRVCRIDPRLESAHWFVVPHGVAPILKTGLQEPREESGNLKVLVPGHINGGKGELLLTELIPRLPEGVELVLLGSAHLSSQLASERVTTIDHYQREELGDFIDNIKPDIAMLASTVPETYGYVLSEMLQLGVPVICSNIGAYAERGEHLPGITLVEPRVEFFLNQLIRFRDYPEQLLEQRNDLPHRFPDLEEMANSWAANLPANPPHWLFELSDDPGIENEVKMNLQLTHLAEILKAVHAATEKNTQASGESLALLAKQQSNIENMLETIGTQNLQLTALLARQNEFAVSLLDKDKELEQLRNAIQEQLALSEIREKAADRLIENARLDFDRKLASAREVANAENLALLNESAELQARLALLDQKLSEMQAKRAWRFLKLFG